MKAVRKQLVVVGLALMVLLLATSAVTRATVEPPRVTVLIGPIARLDGASRWSSYDRARTMPLRKKVIMQSACRVSLVETVPLSI